MTQNSASAAEAASFVDKINSLEIEREEEIAKIKADFQKAKREINKRINGEQSKQYDDAKKMGLLKGNIKICIDKQKALRKARANLEKHEARIDSMDSDDATFIREMEKHYGPELQQFPLFDAAVRAAKASADEQDETTSAIVKLVSEQEAVP